MNISEVNNSWYMQIGTQLNALFPLIRLLTARSPAVTDRRSTSELRSPLWRIENRRLTEILQDFARRLQTSPADWPAASRLGMVYQGRTPEPQSLVPPLSCSILLFSVPGLADMQLSGILTLLAIFCLLSGVNSGRLQFTCANGREAKLRCRCRYTCHEVKGSDNPHDDNAGEDCFFPQIADLVESAA